MKKIIILGTLHAGLTPNEDLVAELKRIKPDQLLVEIADEDLQSGQIESYPSEMIAAYQWAQEQGLPVAGFDAKINVFRSGMTEADNDRVIELQKVQLGDLTWKDLNEPENFNRLNIPEYEKLVDPDQERRRWQAMVENIKNVIADEGTILILTGCGNLKFLRQELC
ncbi:hypothetical protein KJ910_00325 [Patescibacteria group bacterium]|nr:hypothetical protein [Patescibacteria group bacterium]MBU1906629.1 hypothetical protein [Patescibacteria group bacterium]